MCIKSLAEAVIAQAMDDLSDDAERSYAVRFFKGQDFRTCAETAGMDLSGQITLLNMVNKIVCNVGRRKVSNPGAVSMSRKSGKYLHAIRTNTNRWSRAAAVK